MKIGRLGTWYALDKLSGAQMLPFLALLERLNYNVLWYPESRGYRRRCRSRVCFWATARS